jgi:hypothetical protein
MKMEQTECFETSAYKIQTPGNHPKENIQHREHGESLKSRIISVHRGLFGLDGVEDARGYTPFWQLE